MTTHNNAFGKVLRVLRKQKQYTQESLAFESGLDRTYVSLLELGRRSPTLDTMMALCEPLDVSLSVLCTYIEDEMTKDND
jgi:transcriptional regulator with XRE-family HTH domain